MGRQVLQALVGVQHLFLLVAVLVVDGREAESGSQGHFDRSADFAVEDVDDSGILLDVRRLEAP